MDSQNTQSEQTEFRYIDGRRFHNVETSMYHLPNDDNETNRLHLQHFLIRYLYQSNFSAPVNQILSKPGAKVLDVGCGAASWSFDIATTYPLAKVIGLDISPYQSTMIKPKNFEFVKGNVQERLPFDDNTFDFVFQRYLLFGITKEKWPHVVNELVRVLRPGGFLELCEPSGPFEAGPITKRFWDCESEILEERGCDFDLYQKIEEYARNQGQLENNKKESKRCYYGTVYNNVEFNKAVLNNLNYAYASLKPILSKKLQVSDEEYDELAKISEKESVEHNTYYHIVRVYASKVI
ncbi:S-adenosyl-L-methionine-dependent methyltransferase [Gigaspora rosea]|uniref:S-adenosyl-L-methionine-dependent methyltransferase n=1 Tax=Gigaspora rosea TaxID=44941 RepID=A0A397UFT5_9GLOM|nr:S-adenosyl-L-methionine-dependent methyltransferase [Gigaspora rosea]CAG8469836.1 24210_t:CDS:2 [Gigaspora rosea]